MKAINTVRAFLLICLAANGYAGTTDSSTSNDAFPGLRDAVILIIRHAEKPESGPGLSAAGEQRAAAYVNYFEQFTLDSKPLRPDYLAATADSEASHRPRLTLNPLSTALGLKLNAKFKSKDCKLLAADLQSAYHGKCILIAWHHGEIPELIQALGAEPASLLPNGKWPAEQFAWLIVLRFDHEGKLLPAESRRISENLMPGDSGQ